MNILRANNTEDGEKLVGRIKEYIDAHIANRLSRDEIAGEFYISKDYISHLFSQYEQKRFARYVTERKMERAAELIRTTELSLKTVAESVGIADYAYFSKLFREYAGMSANEYRNASGQ